MPDIKFYLSLFFRRLPIFLLFVAIGTAVGGTIALILPPQYIAEARLVVESEQIPDELAASTVQTEANEQLQIIQQRILTRNTLLDMANRLNIYRSVPGQPAQNMRPDEIVRDLRDRIRITTTGANRRRNPDAATLVSVSFAAPTANLASSVANEVVTLILEESVSLRTGVSGQTLEFFEQEVARLDQELAERSARVITFKNANREALPDSLDFRRNQLSNLQERLLQVEREETSLKDRREGLVALFEATGQVGPTAEQEANLTAEARELRRLQERYATSVAALSMENPRVKVMRDQIAALEEMVAQQNADALASEVGPNGEDGAPLSVFDIQLADLDNQLEFLTERRTEIEEQMRALEQTINATAENAIALQTLERDYQNLRSQYDQAVANMARAETGDMIEALSKGQRISVIEQATAPNEPNSPDRPKLLMMGIGAGVFAGLAILALIELLNTAVRRPGDIVSKLDITPFATLSFIRTRRDIFRRRVFISVAFVLVLAGIPAGLWAIDTFYRPLDLLFEQVLRNLPVISRLTV